MKSFSLRPRHPIRKICILIFSRYIASLIDNEYHPYLGGARNEVKDFAFVYALNYANRSCCLRLAILPQGLIAPEGIPVQQLVKQERYPHQRWF